MDRPGLNFFSTEGDPDGPNLRPSLFFFLFMATWTALITFVFKLKRIRCRFASIENYWDREAHSFLSTSSTRVIPECFSRGSRLSARGRISPSAEIPAFPACNTAGPRRSAGGGAGMTKAGMLFLFVFIFSLAFFSTCFAEPAPNPALEGILQKIESRHYRWIAIRAEVYLFFAKAGDPNAMCGGELLYQRLDERMFLTCTDTRQELVFVFRTLDRRFDLYLPAQKTVYHGSIFDLEDSPDIESHLKARDLYRALKPIAVDPRRAKVERTSSLVTNLDVYSQNGPGGALARRLYLTPEGDVRGEIYYGANGRSVTEIQRYDFKEFRGHVGIYDSIIFPKKITIISPETQKGTALFFSNVKALDTVDSLEFLLSVPDGTKEVFLDEKSSRLQDPKRSAVAPTPPAKAVPVYFATPLKKPAAKIKPAPERKGEAPKVRKPVSAPQAIPEDQNTPAEADLVVEAPSPAGRTSLPDDQTTLDPSVEPSSEMGKQ